MKFLLSILRKIIPKELPKPMGRWTYENCDIKLNQKIDLSNEDHCGPCGQYLLSKKEIEKDLELNKNILVKKN
jgi:hypothetical protein